MLQWRIQGRGQGGPSPLFLDQTEARRSEKKTFGDRPSPPYLRLDDQGPPPPYLKFWIRHCVIRYTHILHICYKPNMFLLRVTLYVDVV